MRTWRRSMLVAAACLGACGGPDPLIGFIGGEPIEGVDATVRDSSSGCGFCSDAPLFFDTPPPPPPPPPPVICPLVPPIPGGFCNVPNYEKCEYGSSTSYYCNEQFICVAGQWVNDSQGQCAPTEPCSTLVDGGGCQSPGQACGAPDTGTCVCMACGGGPPAPTTVDGGTNQGTWRCFSPGPGCSGARANSGTPCDMPDGSVCAFGGGCCAGVVEACDHGVWLASEGQPCP